MLYRTKNYPFNFASATQHTMKKIFTLAILCLMSASGFAQYYYKDIVSNRQARTDMLKYRDKKVKSFKINSLEADGTPSKGFFAERKFARNYLSSDLFTRSEMAPPTLNKTVFDENGRLLSNSDSSELSTSHIRYRYDEDGRVVSIYSVIRSLDDDFLTEMKEEHLYVYEDDFYPDRMLRIMNGKDTTVILFSKDEAGNITIEKDTRSGHKYYYYYDSKSRLTDIVHRSEYKDQMVPDYMFEYNQDGELTQMVSTEEGGSYYFIWKYGYKDGLRVSEECYSKERQLMGTIRYDYRF